MAAYWWFLFYIPTSVSSLIRDPPSAAELVEMGYGDFEQSFPGGQFFEFARFACEFAS